jgi:hypothetical protein
MHAQHAGNGSMSPSFLAFQQRLSDFALKFMNPFIFEIEKRLAAKAYTKTIHLFFKLIN